MRPWAALFWLWTALLLPSDGARLTPSAFSFIGPTNRIITPNNDKKNDTVVFVFDNPFDSEVRIRIYDTKGKVVVDGLPPGPNGIGSPVYASQIWDAKAGGTIVPGGVYVYVIDVEGAVVTGSVVVVR